MVNPKRGSGRSIHRPQGTISGKTSRSIQFHLGKDDALLEAIEQALAEGSFTNFSDLCKSALEYLLFSVEREDTAEETEVVEPLPLENPLLMPHPPIQQSPEPLVSEREWVLLQTRVTQIETSLRILTPVVERLPHLEQGLTNLMTQINQLQLVQTQILQTQAESQAQTLVHPQPPAQPPGQPETPAQMPRGLPSVAFLNPEAPLQPEKEREPEVKKQEDQPPYSLSAPPDPVLSRFSALLEAF
jgi:Arc/MetJ-type ribon-helix-helix transcriptional regulator